MPSLEEELIKAVQASPSDELSCYALADFYEERGGDGDCRTNIKSCVILAAAYRWMGKTQRRPAYRAGKTIKKPWGWYKQDGFMPMAEKKRFRDNPQAHINPHLFMAIRHSGVEYKIFLTHNVAVYALGEALIMLRAVCDGDVLAVPR